MRKLILSIILLSAITTQGWAAAADKQVSGIYNRAGFSLIVVKSEGHSSDINKWVYNYAPDNKFDYNSIETRTINHRYSDENRLSSELRHTITATLAEEKVGQQIVSHIFNRQSNGVMDDKIVRARGVYNATKDQVMSADAAAIGKSLLEDNGYKLLKKTYVVFLEFYEHKAEEGTMSAKAQCVVYKLNLSEELLNDVIFGQTWVEEDDDEATRNAKNERFDNIEFEFDYVTTIGNAGYATARIKDNSNFMQEIYNSLYNDTLYKLSAQIEDFMVQTSIKYIHPIKAQIGKKESLKNGERYDTYEFIDVDGKIKAKRRGIVRATTVCDNRVDNSLQSEFIQVAGRDQATGYVLKQRNDHKMTLTPFYRMGAMEGYGANFDVLSSIETSGKTIYGGLYLSFSDFNMAALGAAPELYLDSAWSAYNAGIRLVRAHRFMRYFEAGLHLNLGLDAIKKSYITDEELSDEEHGVTGSMFSSTLGAQFKVNIFYPLHFTAGVDYTYLFGAGAHNDNPESSSYRYNVLYNSLKALGQHRDGLGYSIGVTYAF